jgi:hypothetical protein
MIRRKAIIVGAPREVGGGAAILAGVSKDVHLYRNFLLSEHGGAWNSGEIRILDEPSKKDLLQELASAGAAADYTVTIFSGHGGHIDKNSEIFINQWESIRSIQDFRTGAAKELAICDTCRTIEGLRKLAEDKAGLGRAPDPYRDSCRSAFDQAVIQAPASRDIMWACSVGETASDTGDGGLFSKSLIDHALQWARGAKQAQLTTRQILNVPNAFAYAKTEVQRHDVPGHTQTPEIATQRGLHYLPFAVA